MNRRFVMATVSLLLLLTSAVGAQTVNDLAAPAGPGASEPFLFASKDTLLLSWMEPAGDRTALRFARFAQGKWSEPRTIAERDDFFLNWADLPSVIEDANGALFAHWLQKSGKDTYAYDVHLSISLDGGRTWGSPLLLNRDGRKNEHGFASLASLPKGGIGVTWLDGRNMPEGKEEGEMTLRYATIDARGVIGSDVQLDARTCECCTTGMAMAGGRPVIAYRDRSPDEVRDIAIVRQTANGWTRPRLLHPDGWKIAGCPVNGPQVAGDGHRLAGAWFTGADGRGRVYAAFSDDAGAHFSDPVTVDEGRPAGRVDVVLLDRETAVVTWSEQTPGGAELRARRVPREGALTPSFKVADSSTARAAGFARTAALGGEVFAAWTEQTAAGKRIHVSRLRW